MCTFVNTFIILYIFPNYFKRYIETRHDAQMVIVLTDLYDSRYLSILYDSRDRAIKSGHYDRDDFE